MGSDLIASVEDYLAERRVCPPTYYGEEFDVVPTDYLVRDTSIKPRPIAVDKIMRVGDLVLITAPQDNLKSTFALELVHSLATGEPFLGRFETINPLSMVMLQSEIDPGSYRERVEVLGGSPNLFACSDFTFSFDKLVSFVRYLDSHEYPWDGIAFDPIGEMWPAQSQSGEPFSENAKTHVTPILKALKLLGKTIILVHHDPKKSQGFQGWAAGSSALLNVPDVRIHLDRDRLSDAVTVNTQNRLQQSVGTFYFQPDSTRRLKYLKYPPKTS